MRGVVAVLRRLLLLALVLALAAGAVWLVKTQLLGHGSGPEKVAIQTAPVEPRNIEQVVRTVGELVSAQATDIKSEISARVQALHVKAGDKVELNDILVELDAEDVKAEMEEVTFQAEASAIRIEKAKLDYDRKKALRTQNFLMEKDLMDADIELRLAKNALDGQRARQKIVQERLAKSTIRAPHAGTVLNLKVREGVVITGANTSGETSLLMQIADTARLMVQSDVNEVDNIKIAVGVPARVTFESVPGAVVEGTLETLALSAIPKDKDKTVRVFPLTIVLHPTTAPIKPGITASIAIAAGKVENALAVPVSAVFAEEGRVFVYAEKAGGGFEDRAVQIGISDTRYVEIRSGLKAGEKVALQRPPTPEQKQAEK
jgi:HlyD family secretion protein